MTRPHSGWKAEPSALRGLRVELLSDAHTPLANYVYEGWDVALTAEWQTLELRFDAAVLPSWATAADRATQNALEDVLRTVLDLRMIPECVGRNAGGYLGDGAVDQGFVELDDLEFF